MRRLLVKLNLWIFIVLIMGSPLSFAGSCPGRFVNPMTDICWKCVFPIKIAGFTVAKGGPDPKSPKKFICECKDPFYRVGIPIAFWEPSRLVDVTRIPFCLVNMGGLQALNPGIKGRGDVSIDPHTSNKRSFYHIHWYMYPLLYWLEVLLDFVCLEKGGIDLMYITEIDPFWGDDEKNAILNPEGILFGNPIAQAACAADCVAASTNLPLDSLFWCGGCQGSLYPFAGTVREHVGGIQASLLATQRFIAKLHREGVLWGYMGKPGFCGKYYMPLIKKSQYRTQMTFPIPQTKECPPLGKTNMIWGMGREFPYKGSDFGYLIWRKRDCCLF
jgi:conjugal transfer pilus assembly protein TraU